MHAAPAGTRTRGRRHRARLPQRRRRPLPGQAHHRRAPPGQCRHLRGRPQPRRGQALLSIARLPGRVAGRRHAGDGRRPLDRCLHAAHARPLRVHRHRLDRPIRDLATRPRRAGRGGPRGRPRPGRRRPLHSSADARRRTRDRSLAGRPGPTPRSRHADRPPHRGRPGRDVAAAPGRPTLAGWRRAKRRVPSRRRAPARKVRRLVRDVSPLGRHGSLPQCDARGSGRAAARHRRNGLRRPVSASDSSDRPDRPQGPARPAAGARGGSRQPVGRGQRRGRPLRHRAESRHAGGLRPVRRAGPGGRPRDCPRSGCALLTRPSVRARAPRMVPATCRRLAPARRESA